MYYQDITLLPDSEISLGFIWEKTYAQLHVSLVKLKNDKGNSDISISFPEYEYSKYETVEEFPLGVKLRLFSQTQEKLQELDISAQLTRLSDYCHCSSIKQVPEVTQYAFFSRKQSKPNIEKKARRLAKKTDKSLEDALAYLVNKGFTNHAIKLPYINVKSSSTSSDEIKRGFRLFIAKEISSEPVTGTFNCYGLSKTATVPWF